MNVENPDMLRSEIEQLKKERGAVILAHYYQKGRYRILPTI